MRRGIFCRWIAARRRRFTFTTFSITGSMCRRPPPRRNSPFDYAGRRISSWLSPSNYGNEGRIYWGGQQVAYRSTDGTTYFDHQDTLGTERGRTNYAGSAGSTYVSMPWGDGY